MEWQTYVDERLMAKIDDEPDHQLTAAAILGYDGTVKAKSSTFPEVTPEEIEEIMKEFAEPGYLATTGLFLGGKKYLLIQGDPNVIIRATKGHKGVCIMKTKQTLVFGCHDDAIFPVNCSIVVQVLGEDLVRQGF